MTVVILIQSRYDIVYHRQRKRSVAIGRYDQVSYQGIGVVYGLLDARRFCVVTEYVDFRND